MKVTVGELCDRLSILNIKIFFKENLKRDSDDDKIIADATRATNDFNVERNAIISEINLELNEIAKGNQQKIFGQNKMYGK